MRITNEQNDIQSVLFSEVQIRGRVAELGAQLTAEYADKNPLVVCILKGRFLLFIPIFAAWMKCHLFMDFTPFQAMVQARNPPAWCASSRILTRASPGGM